MLGPATMRLASAGFALLIPACLGGCLGGYAYPRLAYVPGAQLAEPHDEIHAFRLDATNVLTDFNQSEWRCELSPIPPSAAGTVPGQAQVSLETAWGVLMLLPTQWTNHRWHALQIRLYRPGYQVVAIEPWQSVDPIHWKEAADWPAQEQAVNDLIGACRFDYFFGYLAGPGNMDHLAPGTASVGHRQALVFAAAEYERVALLAAQAGAGEEVHTRLTIRAQRLRELAGK